MGKIAQNLSNLLFFNHILSKILDYLNLVIISHPNNAYISIIVVKCMAYTTEEVCPKCKGTGRVRDKDGTVHVCYDCLAKGKMDQHEKNPKSAKDFGIKL